MPVKFEDAALKALIYESRPRAAPWSDPETLSKLRDRVQQLDALHVADDLWALRALDAVEADQQRWPGCLSLRIHGLHRLIVRSEARAGGHVSTVVGLDGPQQKERSRA